MLQTLPDRIRAKITVGPGCWPWTAARNASGYGIVRHDGRSRLAHRVVFEASHGSVADGELDHLCRNRACKNGHPFAGTNLFSRTNVNGKPRRDCRQCHRDAAARARLRKAA